MPSSKPLAEYARKRDFRQTPEPSGRNVIFRRRLHQSTRHEACCAYGS
ncbi:hypothetical protein LZM17_25310 [Pseudomonas aeruginosa]|nr:hypothetical protein [Pseudomonas aeruginosa]